MHRDTLLEKEKISKKPGQDYRYILNCAYYTYLTQDAEFEKQMQKVMKLYTSLFNMIIEKNTMQELKLDPLSMNPILFNEFYNRLEAKYIHGITVPSLI